MDILQRAPELIGQSALHNSEIQTIELVDIVINNIDYNRKYEYFISTSF